jgi:hypothetical protein
MIYLGNNISPLHAVFLSIAYISLLQAIGYSLFLWKENSIAKDMPKSELME